MGWRIGMVWMRPQILHIKKKSEFRWWHMCNFISLWECSEEHPNAVKEVGQIGPNPKWNSYPQGFWWYLPWASFPLSAPPITFQKLLAWVVGTCDQLARLWRLRFPTAFPVAICFFITIYPIYSAAIEVLDLHVSWHIFGQTFHLNLATA